MPASIRSAFTAAVPAVAILAVAVTVAQQPPEPLGRWLSDYPLPAIDRGLRDQDPPRPPRTSALRYLRGSIVVKFRAGTSATARRSMAALVDGNMTPAMSNADFDVLRLDDGADPERAAARLSAQPDVDYAQARYLARPLYVPNDPFYSRQWNFPALDMERAWDINPGATSSITVAVLDSGVAYTQRACFSTPRRSWREGGVTFPALGRITVPFAAAPGSGRPRPVRRAARLHLGRPAAARPRRARHPRRRHRRPADEQQRRRRRHGLQRAHHAGEGHRRRMGLRLQQPVHRHRRHGGAGHPLRGGQRRQGAQPEHRPQRPAGAGGRGRRRGTRYRAAVSWSSSGGNDFDAGSPPERYAEFAPRVDGMVAVAAVGREKQRAGYSSVGAYIELAAPGGDFTAGRDHVRHPAADLRPDPGGNLCRRRRQYRAPRFDCLRVLLLHWHVDGHAARVRVRGAC